MLCLFHHHQVRLTARKKNCFWMESIMPSPLDNTKQINTIISSASKASATASHSSYQQGSSTNTSPHSFQACPFHTRSRGHQSGISIPTQAPTTFSSKQFSFFLPIVFLLELISFLTRSPSSFESLERMLKLLDFSLRLSVIPLSVATIWLTVTNKQDNSIYGYLKYSDLTGLK